MSVLEAPAIKTDTHLLFTLCLFKFPKKHVDRVWFFEPAMLNVGHNLGTGSGPKHQQPFLFGSDEQTAWVSSTDQCCRT